MNDDLQKLIQTLQLQTQALQIQSDAINALAASNNRLADELMSESEADHSIPAYDLSGKPIVIR